MHLTYSEWWSLAHGFVFGSGFLLSFAGVMIVIYGLRRSDLTEEGLRARVQSVWASPTTDRRRSR